MQQILVRHFGDPCAVCEPVDRPPPMLSARGVRVRMIARPINPSDLIPITGAYRSRLAPPFVPGFEGVGRIVEVGSQTHGFAVGDRVLPLGKNGTWAEEIVADADWCVPVPAAFGDDDAAQLYINPTTAWWIMRRELDLKPGDGIAVNACGSAISRMFLAIAKARGLRFIAIVRGAQRARQWRDAGADRVIDRELEDIGAVLAGEAGALRVKAGLDAVGGADGLAMAQALPAGSSFIHYGLLSGRPLPGDLSARVGEAVDIRLFWLRNVVHAMDGAGRAALFRDLFDFFKEHPVALPVEARYRLADIGAALAHHERSGRNGKILLVD